MLHLQYYTKDSFTRFSFRLLRFNLNKTRQQFSTGQFHIPEYETRATKDRNKHEGCLTEYVKKDVICKRK